MLSFVSKFLFKTPVENKKEAVASEDNEHRPSIDLQTGEVTGGYLRNNVPEIGDYCFSKDGKLVGKLEFFYDKITEIKGNKVSTGDAYRVKISDYNEDPVTVSIVDVLELGILVGKRLVVFPNLASKVKNDMLGAKVIIS